MAKHMVCDVCKQDMMGYRDNANIVSSHTNGSRLSSYICSDRDCDICYCDSADPFQVDMTSSVKRCHDMISAFISKRRRYIMAAVGAAIASIVASLAVKGALPTIVVQFLIGIGAIVGAIIAVVLAALAVYILLKIPMRISNYVYRRFCTNAASDSIAAILLDGEDPITWVGGVLMITLPVMVPYLIWLLGQYIQTLLHH